MINRYNPYLIRSGLLLLILIPLCSLFSDLSAQVSGIVKNSSTEEVLSGITVTIGGTQTGMHTDENGFFEFDITRFPITITLSSVGFKSRSIPIFNAVKELVIYLDPEILGMDEIVIVPDRTINPITNYSHIAISSVSLDELTSRNVTTAVDVLRAESGVFIQQTSVGQGSIYVRGRAGRDVLYLFNGFRINPSFVRSGQNQYFGAIDPLLVNQIDVYRGPVSVYYGSDALSGGVNVSPIVKEFTFDNTFSGEARSIVNFNGNGEKSIHAKASYQSPGFTFFAGGSFRDFDYYKMSDKTDESLWFPYDRELENADFQFKSFELASRIKTSSASDLTLVSYLGEIPDAPRLDRVTMGYGIEDTPVNEHPRSGYYSNTSPLLFWGNTAEYSVSTQKPFFENISLKAGYFKLKDHRKEQDYAFNNSPEFSIVTSERDYSFGINDTTSLDQNTSDQFQFSLDVQSSLSEKLYIKWGTDFSYDIVSSKRFTNYGTSSLPRYPDDSRFLLTGIFGQIDQAVNDRWNLEYGIRYSHTFIDIPFEGINTSRKHNPYTDNFGQFTGSFGVTYTISKTSLLISNLSTGFRAPNVADLSEVGIRGSAGLFQTTSSDLKPEKTLNYDLGIRHNDGLFSLELIGYWLHYFDKIKQVPTGRIVDNTGSYIRQGTDPQNADEFAEITNQNVNSLDLFGIETKADYMISSQAKTGLTFTYTYGTLNNEDNTTQPVNRVPPANGIFYIDYSPIESLSIRPQARYAFAHRRISPDEIQDVRVSKSGTDGFVNLQLIANYQIMTGLHFKLIFDNIADAAYREHASSLDGMGRNFTLSLKYIF